MAQQGPARVLHVSAADHTAANRDREDRPGPLGTTEPSIPRVRRSNLGRMELTPARRRALSTALALVLAIESVSAVAATAQVTTDRPTAPASRPEPAVHVAGVVVGPAAVGVPIAVSPKRVRADRLVDPVARIILPSSPPDAAPAKAATPAQDKAAKPKPDRHRGDARQNRADRQRAADRHDRSDARKPTRSHGGNGSDDRAPSYGGRNHLWIPSLGVSRSISWFPCSRSREPDNYVYRWGCAGSNNVYLLGHAWGVFEPLHDAYTRGRLRKGMKAVYADANGRVRTYAVRFWKVVRPTTAASWAWASLSNPSMTLQTCVGARSQYRLMVRLAQVDG
jgi:hypothetical protein